MAPERNGTTGRFVSGLGWFSVGLGLTEIIAPGTVTRIIGLPDRGKNRALTRLYGVRELAAGVAILSQSRPAPWLWARVAGDALDLVSLGKSLGCDDTNRVKTGFAAAAVAGVTALDIYTAKQLSQEEGGSVVEEIRVVRTINIDRSPAEVYHYWRDFHNLPKFMKYLSSVEQTGERRSHWVVDGPGGKRVQWDAELVEDEANYRISWRTLAGSDVEHSGSVEFLRATGNRGTLVKIDLEYLPPGGVLGTTLAKIFGLTPGLLVEENLRALKQILETGEIARSDASIHPGMHPAQPAPSLVTA
jgi:uncharacterized membrane protein